MTKSASQIILLLFFASLISCQSEESRNKKALADSLALASENAPTLPTEEMQHLHNACKQFFDSLLPGNLFNGSILVARKGVVVFEEYKGYSDPVQKLDTLRPNTAFHLASVSKTFTGMATLKLWEQGKLSLEDSLGKFFVAFPYKGITVKMLLNHRSGLPNYLHYLEHYKWDKRKMVTNNDVLQSLYGMRPPLDFPSGKQFAYCNTNYVLLALIIENVSGLSFKEFMETTFFKPLQMNDSYVFTPADMPRALPSFEWNNRKYPYEFLDMVYGDKNIYSTVRDLHKWDQALYPGNLFTQATLDSAFLPYSFEKPGRRNYGLGWRLTLMDNGKKLLYHNGWWHGNNSVFIRLLDEQSVIIVLSNKFNSRIYSTKNLCNVFADYTQATGIGD